MELTDTQTDGLTDRCSDTNMDIQKQQRVKCLFLSFRASDVKKKTMTLTDKALIFKQQYSITKNILTRNN